jgi:iron complex transport system ATP-binding protein
MYSAEGIRVTVRSKTLVDEASISVKPGSVTVIVGPNGAGKSTLLKVLAGELRPVAGFVALDGNPIAQWDAAALAARRAVLPQAAMVAFPFLAREIVALGLPARVPSDRARQLIVRGLATVGMLGFAERVYDTLSGGERQRVQLARVLSQLWAHGNDGYLLLDEPTAALDLPHQLATLNIARTHASSGGGVLAVLHDINLAVMAADEIVAMKEGRVIAAGPPGRIVTDALMRELYDVSVSVRAVPDGPFLLPQTIRQ